MGFGRVKTPARHDGVELPPGRLGSCTLKAIEGLVADAEYAVPAAYCEIIKCAIGNKAAAEFTLFGQVHDLDAASRTGVVQKTVAPD